MTPTKLNQNELTPEFFWSPKFWHRKNWWFTTFILTTYFDVYKLWTSTFLSEEKWVCISYPTKTSTPRKAPFQRVIIPLASPGAWVRVNICLFARVLPITQWKFNELIYFAGLYIMHMGNLPLSANYYQIITKLVKTKCNTFPMPLQN